MILIVAEKPSLGRNIAGSIGNMTARSGYMEGNGYIVTWAFGHLFSLADIEEYSPSPREDRRWTMDNLPCFPKEFRFELRKGSDKKVDSGVVKQFELIRTLCNRDDVDTIVNAGDADREGEIIVRLCVKHALKEQKAFKRLWLPDQTPETIRKALSEMKDESEYESLANEGLARTYIDWLYGVNLTRYATLKTGTLLRVGRVIIPIVKAIYDRDMAIRYFVPGKYYAIISRAETGGEVVELVSKTRFDSDKYEQALAFCNRYNGEQAVVTSIKKKKDKLAPGKLYSLSKLQNVLGKKYKMSMAESLEIVQKLYEAGYLTYPRTNSEYLATAEKDKMKIIIANCKKLGYPVEFKDKKTIFDDSKIESHSALTPTYKIPDKSRLSEREMQVYSTVFRRFIAVFCAEECVVERSEITISVGELEEFLLKGTVIVEPGWTRFDDNAQKDKLLPKLNKGDIVNTDFKPVEKETTPPKHYTIETLNNYLKNPFREEKKKAEEKGADENTEVDDTEDYKAIFEGLELGTEATRTGIIDNARKSEYIELKKDVYTILPRGEFLIESLSRLKINMDKYKTSELGQALKKVYRGAITVEDSVQLAQAEIQTVFDKKNVSIETDDDTGCFGDLIGKCPLCGKDVVRGRFSYGCRGYKEGCDFKVNLYICERAISVANMRSLLEKGSTDKIVGFRSKRTGKTFDASLRLEDGKANFVFEDSPNRGQGRGGAPFGYMEAPPEMAPLPEDPPPAVAHKPVPLA
ncbi:MAG: topoisomerase C-terminal repeat-containing protein [Clostridia bacterium]|nr:topoisomerase C-terminal repeat-containing protein [Clostridia bacterium]